MSLERRNFEQLGPPAGPYTHAVRHGSTLYTSGFTAYGTKAQSGSAYDQTFAIMDQLEFIAAQYGRTLGDLVKVTVFAAAPEDIPEIRAALTDRYGTNVPASSLVMVSSLFAAGLRVEIEGVFAI